MNATCVICGCVDHGGNGRWAFHADDDCTPVCRGKCWREYSKLKAEAKALGFWESLYPGLVEDHRPA